MRRGRGGSQLPRERDTSRPQHALFISSTSAQRESRGGMWPGFPAKEKQLERACDLTPVSKQSRLSFIFVKAKPLLRRHVLQKLATDINSRREDIASCFYFISAGSRDVIAPSIPQGGAPGRRQAEETRGKVIRERWEVLENCSLISLDRCLLGA